MKNFPLHLNFVAALPCKTNTSMNVNVTLQQCCFTQQCKISTKQQRRCQKVDRIKAM